MRSREPLLGLAWRDSLTTLRQPGDHTYLRSPHFLKSMRALAWESRNVKYTPLIPLPPSETMRDITNGLPTPSAESGPSLGLLPNTAFQAAPTNHLALALLSHSWDQPFHSLSRNIIGKGGWALTQKARVEWFCRLLIVTHWTHHGTHSGASLSR